jgi:hypothetical protein
VSLRLVVRPLAEQDLVEAQRWYEEQRPGLGEEFRITVDRLMARILERPGLSPEMNRGLTAKNKLPAVNEMEAQQQRGTNTIPNVPHTLPTGPLIHCSTGNHELHHRATEVKVRRWLMQ